LAAGAVIFLVVGAALAQSPNASQFSLKKGSKWVYQSGDLLITVVADGTEKFGAEECMKLDTVVGGKGVASELVYVNADGVYRTKVRGGKVEPPVRLLRLPAKKGESWRIDSKVGTSTIKGELKITDDKARVKVPAGEFDAVLVEGADLDIAGVKVTVKQWFVPNKGIVKTEFVLQGITSTLELTEYTEGK
jgi:hypothetical protein